MEKELNLIQQLQQTPKWKEFKDWYNQYIDTVFWKYDIGQFVGLSEITEENSKELGYSDTYQVNFCFLPPEFQKGVFEKFIENQGNIVEQQHTESKMEYSIWIPNNHYVFFDSFKQLLIWYFNN